jgi:hypothetical protein
VSLLSYRFCVLPAVKATVQTMLQCLEMASLGSGKTLLRPEIPEQLLQCPLQREDVNPQVTPNCCCCHHSPPSRS